jgi:hypothetical protein
LNTIECYISFGQWSASFRGSASAKGFPYRRYTLMSSQSLTKVSLPVFSEPDYRADGEIDEETYLGSRVRLLLINHFSPP